MSATRDLLIEIGTEDLPARFVAPLADALADAFAEGLSGRDVAIGSVTRYATPRRLAVLIADVAEHQADQTIERKGPAVAAAFKDGAPTKAAEGFAASCGVAVDALERVDTPKGEWLMYRAQVSGKAVVDLLDEVFAEALSRMDQLVPKRMRWGDGDATFVRPVQWLLARFGEQTVPLQAFGLTAGSATRGHRFHAPESIEIADPTTYAAQLESAHVVASFADRRERIRVGIEREAKTLGGAPRVDDALLDEVTALVEWPVVISGHFDAGFLELPDEVLIATVEQHQRYFPIYGTDGALMPAFITVSNIDSRDPQQVIAGNERVVTPRLADAMFFWTQDRRQGLADFVDGLDRVTFHKQLGSLGDKVGRVRELAMAIGSQVNIERDAADRAALLCKADLQTQMVFEFPELQGIMGGHYARASGEADAVAAAVAEHYSPVGAGAPIPATALGRVIALADKLDTLAGIFAVGQAPKGSKDPFALRRAMLGVLRILIDAELPLDLRVLIATAVTAQPAGETGGDTVEALVHFATERLRGVLDVPAEVFEAVAQTGVTVPMDFAARCDALLAFVAMPQAAALAAAHKRVRNLLKQAKGDADAVDAALFEADAERQLLDALERAAEQVEGSVQDRRYTDALSALAEMREPVDAFFEDIMVMADDAAVRDNRLALLRRLDHLCRCVADISCLPG